MGENKLNIKTFNKIADTGLEMFADKGYTIDDDINKASGIILRSAKLHDEVIPENILAIARAGAGVNNIPLEKMAEQGVVVFNTPGANAQAVKELVIAGMLLSARDIVGGIAAAQELKGQEEVGKTVEKIKKNFGGTEILGKKIGVIGLGAIGILVANACEALGMEVLGFDPFLSVTSALRLSTNVKTVEKVDEIYKECDYITVHVPLMAETKNFISTKEIELMKDSVTILNFSRGGLVDSDAVIKALDDNKMHKYVTDFPDEKVLGIDGIIPIPHLGASTAESEEKCAIMAVNELDEYLVNGNIINSVNYPNCNLGQIGSASRLCINHKNVPAMVGSITTVLADAEINIDDMLNRSRGDYAYTMIDLNKELDANTITALESIEGVLKVRNLK